MRLLLINPSNPLVGMRKIRRSFWNRYHVWKPLGLITLAGLTPKEWEVVLIDENLNSPDYSAMPRPDLVGIGASTSQAKRAYDVAAHFRKMGAPVIMGGIHATMCQKEALEHVDAIVVGEAESVWNTVLEDARLGCLRRIYDGTRLEMDKVQIARHDLLPKGYHFGSIQFARGCPFQCEFCSVTAFNGRLYRRRPIKNILQELKAIREKYVLIVDDNLIGVSQGDIVGIKNLFRQMVSEGIKKKWVAQVTISMGDDEELIRLAAESGCIAVLIGFESPSSEGLIEINKSWVMRKACDVRMLVRKIQRHGIMVFGTFMMGLDVDRPGIGRQIAETASQYGLDAINVLFLTPLPGTHIWEKMKAENRIVAKNFPEDWKYYTLKIPVVKYKNLSTREILTEMESCYRTFCSSQNILRRVLYNLWRMRKPLSTLAVNLSYRSRALTFDKHVYEQAGFLEAKRNVV